MSFKWAGVTFDQMSSGLFAPIQSAGLGSLFGGLLGQVTPAHQFQQQVAAQSQAMQQHQQHVQHQMAQQMQQTFQQAYSQQFNHFQSPGLAGLFRSARLYAIKPQADEYDDPMDFDIAMYEWRGTFEQEN